MNVPRRPALVVVLASVLALITACASAGGTSQGSRGANDSQITLEEIESSHQPTLYDVVRALRPTWFRNTATTAIARNQDPGITVYLDEQRAGGLDILRQMPASSASSLRYYGASEAQSRFGLGNLHGVIQVVSAHGPRH